MPAFEIFDTCASDTRGRTLKAPCASTNDASEEDALSLLASAANLSSDNSTEY